MRPPKNFPVHDLMNIKALMRLWEHVCLPRIAGKAPAAPGLREIIMEVASTKGSGAALFDWGALIIAIAGLALGAFIALKATDLGPVILRQRFCFIRHWSRHLPFAESLQQQPSVEEAFTPITSLKRSRSPRCSGASSGFLSAI